MFAQIIKWRWDSFLFYRLTCPGVAGSFGRPYGIIEIDCVCVLLCSRITTHAPFQPSRSSGHHDYNFQMLRWWCLHYIMILIIGSATKFQNLRWLVVKAASIIRIEGNHRKMISIMISIIFGLIFCVWDRCFTYFWGFWPFLVILDRFRPFCWPFWIKCDVNID